MQKQTQRPLIVGGIWLGLGLGGFFDGIVFHQLLQWHHMLTSAGYPATSVANLQLNTLADGLFHVATYLFTLIGLPAWAMLARFPSRSRVQSKSTKLAGLPALSTSLWQADCSTVPCN